MIRQFFILALCYTFQLSLGQNTFRHFDFLGAGHTMEVNVQSSGSANATSTVDGFAIQNTDQLNDASRFLAQSTFGGDMATIQMVAAMGYEAWLTEQFTLPYVASTPIMNRMHQLYGEPEEEDEVGSAATWQQAFFQQVTKCPALLRMRMAFIWSQIMVINNRSDLFEDFGIASSSYYDLMLSNSFTNYRSLIEDVTYSPTMGIFLSHLNNPKADPIQNIHPDENYAREIMQLFSIGLWKLNSDGSRLRDQNNQFIPTYNNQDIKEFAQVFTGLGPGNPEGEFGGLNDEFGNETFQYPMKIYPSYHDDSEKNLLDGFSIPAGLSGEEDINRTLDHLSTHQNTAPFISKSLIRFLTTSNPSPAYVSRVASVFKPQEENNFEEVIKAILLDPEARKKPNPEVYTFGKLKEPLVRFLHFFKILPISANQNDDYLFEWDCLDQSFSQVPLFAPSVFNYFLPEYTPPGLIGQSYLEAPEFQILNSTNSIGFINELDKLTVRQLYFNACVDEFFEEEPELLEEAESLEEDTYADYSRLLEKAYNPSELLDYLNILLLHGALGDQSKATITSAIQQLEEPKDRVRMALYLIMISPDYAILK